jgi:transposase-like protein
METKNVHSIDKHNRTDDPLTDLLRNGAAQMLATAVQAEVEAFCNQYRHLLDGEGRRRVVRNGYLPERTVLTGIGEVNVKVPRACDRSGGSEQRIRFRSSLLPAYLRKSRSIESLLPWLYLKGISTGDFADALSALVGPSAPGLSSSTITRLKSIWLQEHQTWRGRSLAGKRYAYFWADGVHVNVRMEGKKQCLLVVIGATPEGHKELIALEDGVRESAQSWRELLLDLKRRGLDPGPELAVGDGAMGFWKAMGEVYPESRWGRCWVHKTANVLNRLPKSQQPKAKARIIEIYMAETKKEADKAFDFFLTAYRPKYPKAAEILEKDRDEMLAFYDFPAEHWVHLRTTNPIESTFATVRLRTAKTRGCLSRETALTMAFRLCQEAEKKWRRLNAPHLLQLVVNGIIFTDGITPDRIAA